VYSSVAASRNGYASASSQHSALPRTIPITNSTQVPSNQKKHMFMMEGNVGSGKTTIASELEKVLKSLNLNMTVINESTDKYCKKGCSIKDAVNRVKTQLRKLSSVTTEYVVVIIDTCNDKGSGKVVFDYNFSNWNIHNVRPNFDQNNIRGYLEWSLRNVLNRPLHSCTTMHYLNPISASVDICVKVHTDKGKNLFGQRFVKVSSHSTKEQILTEINNGADVYQTYLDQHHIIDVKIQELIDLILN
jgi:hypothetical protein